MTDLDRNIDAAERALGSLPTVAERVSDREMREAWEMRFAALIETTPETRPSARLFDRITAQIAASEPAADNNVVAFASAQKSLGRWKTATLAMGAIAAGLALYVAAPLVNPKPAPQYVAVVTADDGGTAGLIVHLDTGTGIASVIPTGVQTPSGQSLEMWHLPVGATVPVSLGLLPADPNLRREIKAGPDDVFAISLEPLGGSPNGAPTQALYHGQMVEITGSK